MSADRGPLGALKRWFQAGFAGAEPQLDHETEPHEPADDPPARGPVAAPGVAAPAEEPDVAALDLDLDEMDMPLGEVPAMDSLRLVDLPPDRELTVMEAAQPSAQAAWFQARAFRMPKLGDDDSEWEDAFAFDEARGLAAIADGASEGIFSRAWSALLCESLVAEPLDLSDPAAVAERLLSLRAAWLRRIDYPSRRYTQQAKVDRIGAAATVVLLRVGPRTEPENSDALATEAPDDPFDWRVWAVGDSCLFHVRDGRLLASVPVAASSDFGLAPALLRTRADTTLPSCVKAVGTCRPGDLLVLATDAVAQSLLRAVEDGRPPDWARYQDLDPAAWRGEIDALRRDRRIVNDDSTLLCLTVE